VVLLCIIIAGSFLLSKPDSDAQAVEYQPLNNYRPKDFALVEKDGTYHIFGIYVCISQSPPCDTTARGLMHLTSTDLATWTEEGYVVPPGSPGAWDSTDIWAPSVVERDGTYYMFYTGVQTNGLGLPVQKIGVATSTDLYSWTKSGSNPIIDCDDFAWAYYDTTVNTGDNAACRDPNVTWDPDEKQWIMVLSARSEADNSPTAHAATVGIATSDDLLNWNEYGYHSTTNWYLVESPHIHKEGSTWYLMWTDNCSGGKCLKYATSTTAYSGFSARANIGPVGANEYASELVEVRSQDYFARIGNSNLTIAINPVSWGGTPFTLPAVTYGSVGDNIWDDTDGDGVQDSLEVGLNDVDITLSVDDGDGIFDPNLDPVYATATSGDDPNTVGTQTGYYSFTNLLPGTYWRSIDPDNFSDGFALEDYRLSVGELVDEITISSTTPISSDVGCTPTTKTWDLTQVGSFTLQNASLSTGRVVPSVSGGAAWWDTRYRYRRPVTVTAGASGLSTTDTVTTSFDLATIDAQLRDDYRDLRLVYWNGSVYSELDLDIVDSTTQRFRVQQTIGASASDANYTLYYGWDHAPSHPVRLSNVYQVYSSFNAPNATTYPDWAESDSDTNWAVSGNAWRYNATTGAYRYSRNTATNLALNQSYAVEADVTISSGQMGGLAFIRIDTFDDDKYWMNIDAANDRTQMHHWVNGQLGSNAARVLATAQQYRARLEYQYTSANDRTLRGYIDNALTHTEAEGATGYDIWSTAGGYTNNLTSAHVGLTTNNANVTFDDVKAWRLRSHSTAVASEQSQYVAATSTITPAVNQAVSFSRLQAFRVDGVNQNGGIRFIISNSAGTTWMYWNGTAWVESNGSYAQANSASDISAQALSFPTGSGSFLWRAILDAPIDTRPILSSVSVQSNLAPTAPSLSSPADGATANNHPVLIFTSTDTEAEHLVYTVHLDTSPTFASAQAQSFLQGDSPFGWLSPDGLHGRRYQSGTTASFHVTSTLAPGTWYWRVTAIDPSGANIVSSVSATRSFIVPEPLSLSNVKVRPSPSGIVLNWTSSLSSPATIEYGTTRAYGKTASVSATTNGQATITGLTANTLYHMRLSVTNGSTTVRTGDLVGKVTTTAISGVVFTSTRTTITARWVTSDRATTQVRYGRTTLSSRKNVSGFRTTHQVTITGLRPNTAYKLQLFAQGSTSGSSPITSVKTKK